MGPETSPSDKTQDAERAEAQQAHTPDREATPEEIAAADRGQSLAEGDESTVAAHEKEMMDIGAHVKGEGEID